jgi:hypothetical protein
MLNYIYIYIESNQIMREKHPPPLPIQPWTICTVCCILCHAPATLKPTKSFTHTVLRCDTCKLLLFANGELSKRKLEQLNDFPYL